MSSIHAQRRTFNKLLDQDDLGRVKPANYDLPAFGYTYGRPPCSDKEGAKEITTSWQKFNPTQYPPKQLNFRELNKASIRYGLTSSKSFRSFSKANEDVKVIPYTGTKAVALQLPADDFAFGMPNRPSTPVKDVICNAFGNDAADRTRGVYKNRIVETFQPQSLKPKTTKAALLGSISAAKKIEELNAPTIQDPGFKLKKFQNLKPRIDTINRNYVPANQSRRPATASMGRPHTASHASVNSRKLL